MAAEVERDVFNFYVMDEDEYSNYRNREDLEPILDKEEESSVSFKLTIPHDDRWYFVFDLYGKQNDREIEFTLRKLLNK
jgi:hypothetical protein